MSATLTRENLLELKKRQLHLGLFLHPLPSCGDRERDKEMFHRYEVRWSAVSVMNKELTRKHCSWEPLLHNIRYFANLEKESVEYRQKHREGPKRICHDLWLSISALKSCLASELPRIPMESVDLICATLDTAHDGFFASFELVTLLACFAKIVHKRDGIDIADAIMKGVCADMKAYKIPRGVVELAFTCVCSTREAEEEMLALLERLFNRVNVLGEESDDTDIVDLIGSMRAVTAAEVIEYVYRSKSFQVLLEAEYNRVCFKIIYGEKYVHIIEKGNEKSNDKSKL
mmetsp:Transcript_14679/g.14778  ORF Transcript_14679/g.14778 Transcript_14679/m.14778 type:complete len:287 (+) Transcript_14679:137-997(+)